MLPVLTLVFSIGIIPVWDSPDAGRWVLKWAQKQCPKSRVFHGDEPSSIFKPWESSPTVRDSLLIPAQSCSSAPVKSPIGRMGSSVFGGVGFPTVPCWINPWEWGRSSHGLCFHFHAGCRPRWKTSCRRCLMPTRRTITSHSEFLWEPVPRLGAPMGCGHKLWMRWHHLLVPASCSRFILQREKHFHYLKRGLRQLTEAYEVPELLVHGIGWDEGTLNPTRFQRRHLPLRAGCSKPHPTRP